MQKTTIIFLLFILFGCSHSTIPAILTDDYNFLSVEGQVTKIRQMKDTLYDYNFFIEHPATLNLEAHYKIIDSYKSGEFTILNLEWLDTIPLKDEFCPGKRFSIMALKNIDKNQFEYLRPFHCLTRKQLDSAQINNLSLNNKSYLTYFSNAYLKELAFFKKVSTKDAVKEIIDAIGNNNFATGKISYSAEQLNKACIDKGYNPVGAGLIIDSMMKSH